MKQNSRKLMTALLLVWLLGPVEPVFADGIADQFPDVVSRSQANGRAWAVETTPQSMRDSGPWTVEMWSRGRRRYKHFNGQNNSGYTNYPNYSSSSSYGSQSNYSNNNNSSSGYPYNPPASFAALNHTAGPIRARYRQRLRPNLAAAALNSAVVTVSLVVATANIMARLI